MGADGLKSIAAGGIAEVRAETWGGEIRRGEKPFPFPFQEGLNGPLAPEDLAPLAEYYQEGHLLEAKALEELLAAV